MSFKICSIGCGGMAQAGHGPAFRKYAQERPGVFLAACCDVDAARAEAFRSQFGFARAYTGWEEMLRAERPDAISLIVPVTLTEELTLQMLRRKIPVILEKPPGMNREQTLRMAEEAQRTGTPNQVAFNRRYMPMIQRFFQLRQGRIANFWQYDFFRVNRRDQDFSTTCIHGIDATRFLAGSPYRRVEFSYRPVTGAEDWVSTITLDCEFQDGAAGRITFAPMTGIVAERCIMHGTNELISCTLPYHGGTNSADGSGTIFLAQNSKILLEETAPADEESFVSNGFYGENAAFFDCIRMGKRPEGDIFSGLQSVEIADCIRKRKSLYEAFS